MSVSKKYSNKKTQNQCKKGDDNCHDKTINEFLLILINILPTEVIGYIRKHIIEQTQCQCTKQNKVKKIDHFIQGFGFFITQFLNKIFFKRDVNS